MDTGNGHRSRLAVSDGIELSLVEHRPAGEHGGAPPACTFVLVHGLASNARMWDGVGQVLASAGHRAIAVDLRGHGQSSKPDDGYDIASVAGDVCRLLEALEGPPVVLTGQSWGGNVVMRVAARCPQRVAAVAGVDGGAIRLREAYPDWAVCREELAPPPLEGTDGDLMLQHMRSRHPDWPASGIAGAMANFELKPDGTIRPWLTRERHLQVLRGLWEDDPVADYPRIVMPSLLVSAGDSGRAAARARLHTRWFEDAAALLTRGRLVRIPDADHDVHAQRPGVTADLLMGLADRVQAEGPVG